MQRARWLLLGFLTFFCRALSQTSSCHREDMNALLKFKNSLKIDESSSVSSWDGKDCCDESWMGVVCNRWKRVVGLTLMSRGRGGRPDTFGTLSASIGQLPWLDSLVITGMKGITGSIPTSICNLTHLSQLALEDNSLTGYIPPCLHQLASLQAFSVSGNSLRGPLPASLANLRLLRTLSLSRNRLSGPIPPVYKSMVSMQFLDLSGNLFAGPIPYFIGGFKNLSSIDLSNNQFYGPLPESLCDLGKLMDASFAHNQISGEIPECVGRLKSLATLSLGFNRISGHLPESVSDLQSLWSLNLTSNFLSNPLFVGGLPSLLSVDLSRNNFSFGTSLPEWIASRPLTDVRLAGCNLRGSLPGFRRPDVLTRIDLSDNRITVMRPHFFTNMSALEDLDLSNNRLRFDISRLSFPAGIATIDLHSNLIFGSLRHLLSNATLRFLKSLDLSTNLISGAIPDFSDGLIPLKVLNIGFNRISGSIPSSISNLTLLEKLDVSRNHISGVIPPTLGDLSALRWFDLSVNSLTGQIPATLLRLKSLQHANFRSNLLCGVIPQGLPFTVFPAAAYAHNPCLCGTPLLACG